MKKKILAIQVLCVLLLTAFSLPAEAAAKYSGPGIRNNGVYEGITIDIYSSAYTSIAGNANAAYGEAGCTWFVSGRVKELTGKSCEINGPNYWYNTQGPANGFTSTQTMPTAHKSIICAQGNANHVSIIEYVYADGSIIVSDGGCHLAPQNDYCNIGKYSSIADYKSTMGLPTLIGYVDLGVGFGGGSSNPSVDPSNPSNPSEPSNPSNPSNQGLSPFVINSPNERDTMIKQQKGRFLVQEITSYDGGYEVLPEQLIEFPENGYYFAKRVNGDSGYDQAVYLKYGSNHNLSVPTRNVYDNQTYRVEKGIFYQESVKYKHGSKAELYLFYLPASKGLTVNQTLSADKTYVTLSLSSPDQEYAQYYYNRGSVDFPNGKTDYSKTSVSGTSFKVTENGKYSIHVNWSDGEWSWYPMSVTVEVSGITKSSGNNPAQDTTNTGDNNNNNTSAKEQQAPAKTITVNQNSQAKKSAVIKANKTKVNRGKKTVIKITSNSGSKLTVKAKNQKAKNKKYVKIKNGKTAKLTFTNKAAKGTYKFAVSSAAKGQYKKTAKTITIKVK